MIITFVPLVKSHFLLLIKWLQTAHVRLWWDQDIKWTPELIEEKYGEYVNGSKSVNKSHGEFKKPIYAYIICIDNVPIGYIQYYNLHDSPRDSCLDLPKLPKWCASLDFSRPGVLVELNGDCEFLEVLDILLQVVADAVPCDHVGWV